ncbi:MAG: hypothetical protein Q7J32_08810 [Sphingomonadaceae bacterium]|nr:hypothetical protein [Sphingomonadaceae bacterium]
MFFVKDGQRVEFPVERDAVGNIIHAGWPSQQLDAPQPPPDGFIAHGLRQARQAGALFGYDLHFEPWLDEPAEERVR